MTAGGWIDAAWQERGMAALRATLDVDPHHRKQMIQFLFDEGFWDAKTLTWPAAVARWNDCLNPSKPAFFKLGELWALMLRYGRHHLFLAMADDMGYEVRRRPTEERQQMLMERMADTMDRCQAALDAARSELVRMHADGNQVPLPVVRSGAPVRFAADDDGMAPGGF